MHHRTDLHPYQDRAIDYAIGKGRCMLALDMGLGKSISTLTAVSDLLDACLVGRVLVIAPLRVANSVWIQEAQKWEHTRHLTVSVVTGSAKARAAALFTTADIYVINRENLVWLVSQYRLDKWPYDMIVVDESSSFKNHSAKRFKALRKMLPAVDRMVLLTGTPSPNGLQDLWAQMYLIDYGQRLGRTVSAFRQRFCKPSGFGGYKWILREGSQEEIEALVSDVIMHMSGDDYLDLPARIDLTEVVTLPPAAMDDYLALETELFLALPDGEEVEVMFAAALGNKLMQYANGAVYTDDAGTWSETHAAKLDALADIAEDNAGENLLVAYNYRSDLARLRKRFPQAVVLDNDQATLDRWNRGEIGMLLAHPASAGHGLNLQRGGALCVWFGLTWNLEYYLQFNARLHRQGQDRPVRIIHLLAGNTIDARVLDVLSDKDASQNSLLKALKPTAM
tara:strand:- start:338 stop:1690 length:1353 start_codon:yes stop_codon:yes gene_type:complete